MKRDIKQQMYRMAFVLILLLALGAWQFQFVIDAIQANVFLNLTIFGTFGFGIFVAYKNVSILGNEITAFESLREEYEDARIGPEREAVDPYWRFYRCDEPAVIFQTPVILEQAFHIISEEIGRTRNLNMTTGTMQNLLDSIETRLDDQKSLIQYITGLLVFLGLIGTFVGLMITLGSVGAIIGSLDLSGGAGTAAIQGLMDDLRVPLQGMATGFSSSLFGLITSLALGLIGRFGSQAANVLKLNFETWLASVTQVNNTGPVANTGGSVSSGANMGMEERQLGLIFRVARFSVISNTKLAATVDALTDATTDLLATHRDHDSTTNDLADSMRQMMEYMTMMSEALIRTGETIEGSSAMQEIVTQLKNGAHRFEDTHGKIVDQLENISDRQTALQMASQNMIDVLVEREDLGATMSNLDRRMTAELDHVKQALLKVSELSEELNWELIMTNPEDEDIAETLDSQEDLMPLLQEERANHTGSGQPPVAPKSQNSVQMMRERLFKSFPTGPDRTGSAKSTDTATDQLPDAQDDAEDLTEAPAIDPHNVAQGSGK